MHDADQLGSKATLMDGKIVPGAWIVPAIGSSRFTTMKEAVKVAIYISTQYGECVWEAKVEPEPSKRDATITVYQVYIRSLGAMEGLCKTSVRGKR